MNNKKENLSHYEDGFERVNKYTDIWDKIRYKKIYEIEQLAEEVIKIFEKRVDAELLVTGDYIDLQRLFKRMRIKSMSYLSRDAQYIIYSINPKLKNLYKKKKCIRYLEYISKSNESFTFGKVYQSEKFDGFMYTIKSDDNEMKMKCNCYQFERYS